MNMLGESILHFFLLLLASLIKSFIISKLFLSGGSSVSSLRDSGKPFTKLNLSEEVGYTNNVVDIV